MLKLVVTPKKKASAVGGSILERAETPLEFEKYLDVVEAILVNKFPNLSIMEVRKMLNLKEADVTQTRFYQEVLQIGRQEGRLEGEADLIVRILSRRCGSLSAKQIKQVRSRSVSVGESLSLRELESLGEALLDFQGIADLEAWLRERRGHE